MKIDELKSRLISKKIPANSYWLDDGTPCYGEVFCIEKNNGLWEVYYSERGQKTSLKTFGEEKEACDYFYSWLTNTLKRMNLI